MTMKLTFENTSLVSEGVWLAEIDLNDLKKLNGGGIQRGGKSVVMLDTPEFNSISGNLSSPLSDAFVLNTGDSRNAILIAIKKTNHSAISIENAKEYEIDQPFFDSCREHQIPDRLLNIAQQFLAAIREKHPHDELKQGQNRKWIMRPNNFLTITPQVRNKAFRLSVRNSPSCEKTNTIDWKPGMTGYREFILNNTEQIGDAVKVALASGNIGA